MSLAVLPSRLSVNAAWDRYAALVREQADDPTLAISLRHQIAVVRAWKEWRDAFLAMENR